MFENLEVAIDDLPTVETVVWLPMDPKYRPRKLADAGIVFAILAIAAIAFRFIIAAAPADDELIATLGIVWVVPLVVGIPLFIWPFVSVPKKGYAVRDKDILYKSGVFWQTTTAIPFNRIQHVEKSSTPLDRKFRLATLQIFTAGGSGGDLKIHGLNTKIAEKLRTFILEKVGASVEHFNNDDSNTAATKTDSTNVEDPDIE